MNRAFAITMKRPHLQLGIPVPLGRKLSEAGRVTWFLLLGATVTAMVGVYVFQVNQAASKGFALRALEKKLERLTETVNALESQAAQLQTVKAVEERVKDLGYVSVDRLEFMDAPRTAYAMAK